MRLIWILHKNIHKNSLELHQRAETCPANRHKLCSNQVGRTPSIGDTVPARIEFEWAGSASHCRKLEVCEKRRPGSQNGYPIDGAPSMESVPNALGTEPDPDDALLSIESVTGALGTAPEEIAMISSCSSKIVRFRHWRQFGRAMYPQLAASGEGHLNSHENLLNPSPGAGAHQARVKRASGADQARIGRASGGHHARIPTAKSRRIKGATEEKRARGHDSNANTQT